VHYGACRQRTGGRGFKSRRLHQKWITPCFTGVTLLNNPDFEGKSSYQFTAIATDPSGNASELLVTMDLLNKDEAALVITSSTETRIYENSVAGHVLYTAIADDTSDIS